ncbi:Maf family protein, partial [Phascolarctobacterium succinatutens]
MKVILASASPRRQALLQQIGITPLICPADFAEGSGNASQAQEVALYNAAGKCAAVAAKMGDELPVIAADTIVVIDNVILGKPQDAAAAKAMLQRLSGRTH